MSRGTSNAGTGAGVGEPSGHRAGAAGSGAMELDAEVLRLREDRARASNWKRWGPYLPERQWGTVREDYSESGDCWSSFPHEHARMRAYRWGEDGLLGWCDRQCRVCLAPALWNGRDAILKERLFGLTNAEGNHGEDVKEQYFYLDSTPTHSYVRGLYKYPFAAFPYEKLVEENRRRGKGEREYEIDATGVFDAGRYFDVEVEYAKASSDDTLMRLTITNRANSGGAETLHVMPTLWCRNTWSWGREQEGAEKRPSMRLERGGAGGANRRESVCVEQSSLGVLRAWAWAVEGAGGTSNAERSEPQWVFTENQTNYKRAFGWDDGSKHTKDAFHRLVTSGEVEAVNAGGVGTKAAAWYRLALLPGQRAVIRVRLAKEAGVSSSRGKGVPSVRSSVEQRTGGTPVPLGKESTGGTPVPPGTRQESLVDLSAVEFDSIVDQRRREADGFYERLGMVSLEAGERPIARQALAGLLWSKQFYYYNVEEWMQGDPTQPAPPSSRLTGRNSDWRHLFNRDVISVPDKWEYPWYAAWDLAFHAVAYAAVDPEFAKSQLLLLMREWYMHPSGQIPAYEFAFGDVNPPVHAWACWRVYKMSAPRGQRDRVFLARAFHKLMLNFTWWVNRKDPSGRHVFAGGFLGLDNIGVFDRSAPLPSGGHLEQADGTAWMAFFCGTMLSMALELASEDPAYEDVASKFFEHFVAITDAMNALGGTGLWNEDDGFYYDQLALHGRTIPLKVRSLVGVIPLLACEVLEQEKIDRLPGFKKRMEWFLKNRGDLARHITCMMPTGSASALPGHADRPEDRHTHRLLAIPSRERLERVLAYLFDEQEFLSGFGVRSLSKVHKDRPYVFRVENGGGSEHRVDYTPGESTTGIFGGNSNWRGPVWIPMNYLIVEALERYHHFYGEGFHVECPKGSGHFVTLAEAADEIRRRVIALFAPGPGGGVRPAMAGDRQFCNDPACKDLVLFHEHFDGDTGRGLGASHQTGWSALVALMLMDYRGAWSKKRIME